MRKFLLFLMMATMLPTVVNAADDEKGYYFRVDGCNYVVTENSSTVKEVALTCCEVSGNPTEFTVPTTVTHPTTGTVFTVAYIAPNRVRLQDGYVVSSGPFAGSSPSSFKLESSSSGAGPFERLSSSLTTINVPNTIKSITKQKDRGIGSNNDDEASTNNMLLGLSKAVTVNVASDNPYIEVYDGVLYTEDGKRLLLYPTCLTASTYTVREGTEAIAASAFNRGEHEKQSNHDYLTTVVLPASIRTIENLAFKENKKLSSINIPTLQDLIDAGDADASGNIIKGVTIGQQAFFRTKALQSIELPNSITKIGKSAFSESVLTSVEVPGSVETIEERVFRNCNKMTTAILNEGTKYIDLEAFAGCTKMTSVTLPEGLLVISKQAFAICYDLPSMTIPSTVTTIGNYAFAYDSKMTSINIPAGTTLGKGVFTYCNNLETITVDGGTRYQMDYDGGKLDKGVLYGNSNNVANTMDELVFFIPKNKIGASNTDMVKQWIVPNHVRKICAGSIGMTGIESLVLPSNLTTIEELAFSRNNANKTNEYVNTYIKELTIPAKVTNLHFSAFYQTTSKILNPSKNSFFEKVYFMGAPSITTSASDLSIYFLNVDVATATIPSSSYYNYGTLSELAFYVKNSNLSNTNFNTAKTRVKAFSAEIPLRDAQVGENKVSSMCRDFDMDFSNATGVSAYIATSYDASVNEGAGGYKMQKVNYVPSRTGTENDEYHGVIIRMEDPSAVVTYRIGENDYNSDSPQEAFKDASDADVVTTANRLVGVVVNSHVQGTEDGLQTWGLSSGKWQRIVNTGKLTPYNRAYLKPTASETNSMTGKGGQNAKIAMSFVDDDNETTGIKNIGNNNGENTESDQWYTISGQRLYGTPTEKGIYIHNGKKEIIR